MEFNGELVTDYWTEVYLKNESETGNIKSHYGHSQAGELKDFRDELLDELEELEETPTILEQDDFLESADFDGLSDDVMISRRYSHKLVALFAISCGTMEKQLEILLSHELADESEIDGLTADYFEDPTLKSKLELAKTTGVIGNGIYSEAEDVRDTRNDLVHNPVNRLSIDSYDAHRGRIQKAIRAPAAIDEIIRRKSRTTDPSRSSRFPGAL